eukprot:TRINITY_DN20561_c0_g1_i1.p1 TRINITY_DN20561_c0_g1~~TRINITY_DN20561_c0_g1_i1.p1  ORF type:complete len:367 (+),score=103.85 TRINITY_DN20561_c0_g1_i1:80-1180(+)
MPTPQLPDLEGLDIVRSAVAVLAEEGDPAACLRLCAYFGAFFFSIAVATRAWPWRRASRHPVALAAWPTAIVALTVTWRYILRFVTEYDTWERQRGPGSPLPNLLTQAYLDVSDNAPGWLWSAQLLLWVIPGCVFLHTEGARSGITRGAVLAYALIGFLGAISFAFPLVFTHVSLTASPRDRDFDHAPLGALWLCSAAALLCVVTMPLTAPLLWRLPFDAALGTLHVILVVPGLLPRSRCRGGGGRSHRAGCAALYAACAAAAFALHMHNLIAALATGEGLWGLVARGGWSCSCQSSITIDAITISLLSACWMLSDGRREAVPFCMAAPCCSGAAAFAAYLCKRELAAAAAAGGSRGSGQLRQRRD